jgi:hypothetical protein
MLLGSAMSVCELLYFARDASAERRDAAFDRLTEATTYARHSGATLQLILATLDEGLLGADDTRFRSRYEDVRAVVAAAHAQRPPEVRVTYQGMPPPGPMTLVGQMRTSTTGVIGPSGALAKRVEMTGADGTVVVQHLIEGQMGDVTLEAACIEGVSEAKLLSGMASQDGTSEIVRPEPGHWFDMQRDGRLSRMRITTLHDRACVASIEAPPGEVPEALFDAFPASLRLAPIESP